MRSPSVRSFKRFGRTAAFSTMTVRNATVASVRDTMKTNLQKEEATMKVVG